MPRRSAAALEMDALLLGKSPPPVAAPKHFSPETRRYWDEIVASRPHNYFDAPTLPLLEALCLTYATLDDLWRAIHACDRDNQQGFRLYARLLAMANREGKLALMLCTKLRSLPARTEPMPQMARKRNAAPWVGAKLWELAD